MHAVGDGAEAKDESVRPAVSLVERKKQCEGRERGRSMVELGLSVQPYAEELLKEQHEQVNRSQRREEGWNRPNDGVLKINVDGAFKPDTGQGGWGAVIRNSEGVVVRAGAGNIRHAMDAFHAELLAAREGVVW